MHRNIFFPCFYSRSAFRLFINKCKNEVYTRKPIQKLTWDSLNHLTNKPEEQLLIPQRISKRWRTCQDSAPLCYAHYSQVKSFKHLSANVLVKALLLLADHPAPLLKVTALTANRIEHIPHATTASTHWVWNFSLNPSTFLSCLSWDIAFYTEVTWAQVMPFGFCLFFFSVFSVFFTYIIVTLSPIVLVTSFPSTFLLPFPKQKDKTNFRASRDRKSVV